MRASFRLAWTALFALAAGCSSDPADTSNSGGAGGSGAAATTGTAPAGGAGGSAGSTGTAGSAGTPSGLGPATFKPGELDAASHGGTITFQEIGAPGWYPSIRDPASGQCDAYQTDSCCLAKEEVASDKLTPWDRDLIMTLRGPMTVKQFAVYQPEAADPATWRLVSGWDEGGAASGIAFDGKASGGGEAFAGAVGSECLVNVSTADVFPCGPDSSPYCTSTPEDPKYHGWRDSKLFVLLARMSHSGEPGTAAQCSDDMSGNWYDAPWIGLSLGELVRAGAFSSCQCYAKDPEKWYLGDGCGQFNVFEVVNDNNSFKNLDVFSTNFFGYAGYVGEGPCGDACDVGMLGPEADLIDKKTSLEAAMGATASPSKGPGAAFRRPSAGYRYFLILLDAESRTVQLGVVHPEEIPGALAPLLPALPGTVGKEAIASTIGLRLPQ